MMSPVEENYLKVLYRLAGTNGEINCNEISKQLDVKMPTVNSMMKRLAQKGLVNHENYKPVTLTEMGKKEAALIIRKHRLAEMYLVEMMGLTWDQVHSIAEQLEHIQSPLFFNRMDELLNYPKVDPHGSPIPDTSGEIDTENHFKLSDFKAGDNVELMAVSDSSVHFLRFLDSKGLMLGTIIFIESVELFDGSMSVVYKQRLPVTLSCAVCDKLLVQPRKE